jgi:hypothetical protein
MAVSQMIEKTVQDAVELLIGAGGCEFVGDFLEHGISLRFRRLRTSKPFAQPHKASHGRNDGHRRKKSPSQKTPAHDADECDGSKTTMMLSRTFQEALTDIAPPALLANRGTFAQEHRALLSRAGQPPQAAQNAPPPKPLQR